MQYFGEALPKPNDRGAMRDCSAPSSKGKHLGFCAENRAYACDICPW
jgi:hypothetical protein